MSSQLIFITGVSGLVGGATALEALKAGYRLRIALRKEAQIEKIKQVLSAYSDRLEFEIVPDITAPNAYENKLRGVDFVLHHASPLAHGTDKETYFRPAVDGTLSILNEAHKTPTVKKVVITASILSLMPYSGVPDGAILKEDNNWDLSIDETSDFTGANPLQLYHASKLLADQAGQKFLKTNSPSFDLITIHPAFIYGHNIMQTSAEELAGTNGMLFSALINSSGSQSPPPLTSSVHIQNVAEAHVRALEHRPEVIKSGSKYLLVGPSYTWADVAEILKTDYPEVNWGLDANAPSYGRKTDTSKAETELGLKWKSLRDQVHDVVDQQLSWGKKAASSTSN